MRLSCTGGSLCVGFMLNLLYEKYLSFSCLHDEAHSICWINFEEIFLMYFEDYLVLMKNKPLWVIIQNFYHFWNFGERYCQHWQLPKPWLEWANELQMENKFHSLAVLVKLLK
eukprot:UN04006